MTTETMVEKVCEVCGGPADPRPRFQGRWCQPCGDEPLNDDIELIVQVVNAPDLVGQVFERLTVIERASDYINPTTGLVTTSRWLCRCECGTERVVMLTSLINGNTKSCGCYHRDKTSEAKFKNREGQRFGMLTVIKRAKNSRTGRVRWICKCDCGKRTVVQAGNLVTGEVQSCGCLIKERIRETKLIDETGNRYGRWTVIELGPPRINSNGRRRARWLCRCDCGNEGLVEGSNLRAGTSQSCGCLMREISSEAKKDWHRRNPGRAKEIITEAHQRHPGEQWKREHREKAS